MTELPRPRPDQPLQVSQLTRYLKYIVEQDVLLGALSLEGEVAECTQSPAGHIYLTLKDDASQIGAVLFRREAAQQRDEVEQLRRGAAVVVHGFLTVYEPRGAYQVYVERLIVQGDGAMARRFERLRARLEAEGLFRLERKRPIPPAPRTLALVTSPDSQAYHDVLHRLRHQYPFVRVIIAGASVQGPGAADELALAIDIVNRLTDADALILCRGGGSPEDLAAFNDERLARSIFASRVPVITGIGHETDYTVADYVADYRAATPSLAAAAAVPDAAGLIQQIAQLQSESVRQMAVRLRQERRRWLALNRTLVQASPRNRLRMQRQRAHELERAGERAMRSMLRERRSHLNSLRAQLAALDPLAILSRGYAVLTDEETGKVVSSRSAVWPGVRLRAQVADGMFMVRTERETEG